MVDLSREQQEAVTHPGNFFLYACPGSGKTRTTAARISRLAEDGRRVASCSYTHVGVEQIANNLTRASDHPAHFNGTLHRFLLRYVLQPFGHLVTGSTVSPRLVPDEADLWPAIIFEDDPTRRLKVTSFHLNAQGSTEVRTVPFTLGLTPVQANAQGGEDAVKRKLRLAAQGYVSFSDAMYWSLKVLQAHPHIARAVASRFDEIIVDEAQDTTDVQLECLRVLIETGSLQSLVLVGDTDQSIAAYAGASTDGCVTFSNVVGLTTLRLRENYRSSQLICNMAGNFRIERTPDTAVGPDATCTYFPEVFAYPKGRPQVAVNLFNDRLVELGEDPSAAAVLARSNRLCDKLNGVGKPKVADRVARLGRIVFNLQSGAIGRADIAYVESLLMKVAWGVHTPHDLGHSAQEQLRLASVRLLSSAPSLDLDLADWTTALRQSLAVVLADLTDTPLLNPSNLIRNTNGQPKSPARLVFGPTSEGSTRGRTVHQVKGETRPTALLVTSETSSRGSEIDLLGRHLRGETLTWDEQEELRVAFVALTRARRYCALAVPQASLDTALPVLIDAGFRCAPTTKPDAHR
jgi:superfamily I DNA/RNA helicase